MARLERLNKRDRTMDEKKKVKEMENLNDLDMISIV